VFDELWLDREPKQPLLPLPLFWGERTRRDGTENDVNDPKLLFATTLANGRVGWIPAVQLKLSQQVECAVSTLITDFATATK